MPTPRIVVIGASAGGLDPLRAIVHALPAGFGGAIFVVMHIPATGGTVLPRILARASKLEVGQAVDGEAIRPGRIYVAVPDHHLLVERGQVRLQRGPKQNNVRPAVDPLFHTAAEVYGPEVIGVVLSGTRDDGGSGLAAIKDHGGVAIVQSPDDAMYSGMPDSALEWTQPDYVLPAIEIPAVLVRLMGGEPVVHEVPAEPPANANATGEASHASKAITEEGEIDALSATGAPSDFVCPDCGGVLYELKRGALEFRCRTGHGYGADSLAEAHAKSFEDALWAALRIAQESAELARRLFENARRRGHSHTARIFEGRWDRAQARVRLLEDLLGADDTEVPAAAAARGGGGERT